MKKSPSILTTPLRCNSYGKEYPVIGSAHFHDLTWRLKVHLLPETEQFKWSNKIGRFVFEQHQLEQQLCKCTSSRGGIIPYQKERFHSICKSMKILRETFQGIEDEIALLVKKAKEEQLEEEEARGLELTEEDN